MKNIITNLFLISPNFKKGLNSAFTDSLGVVIGAIVAGIMAIATHHIQNWAQFIPYMFAITLLLIGFRVSWVRPAGTLSKFMGFVIASFLSIVASIDALKLLSTLILRVAYWETDLKDIPSFIWQNSAIVNWKLSLAMLLLGTFSIMFLHRSFDAYRANIVITRRST